MMWLYEALLLLGLALYTPKAFLRRRLPHRGWTMRLGRYPRALRPQLGKPGAIWIHAVSVGEVMAAGPLIKRLAQAYPDAPVVLSTVTPTGYEVAARVIGGRGAAIYAPFDFRWTVGRAMEAIRPRALLLVESELWPNLIRAAKARSVPVVVVNGRVSERAHRRYMLVRTWLASSLKMVDAFLMQTEDDAKRVASMGARGGRVKVLGSLKWDASVSARPTQAAIEGLRGRLGIRAGETVIVAGSTHRGEEDAVVRAALDVRRRRSGARLVIAPRHPERARDVERLAAAAGLQTRTLSRLPAEGPEWDALIVDTLGQLPAFYGLASAVFVGGSLIPHGGQNPLEAASLGKPVVVGPFMDNFAAIMERLHAHQGIRQITGPGELSAALASVLDDELEAQKMGRRAQELVEESAGCTQRTVDALAPFLC